LILATLSDEPGIEIVGEVADEREPRVLVLRGQHPASERR